MLGVVKTHSGLPAYCPAPDTMHCPDGSLPICENTCPSYPEFADDGHGCDDGGANSDFDLCGKVGTDCGDCGPRCPEIASPSAPTPPPPAPSPPPPSPPQTTCKLAFEPAPDEDWNRWNVLGLNELLLRDCSGGLVKFKPSSTHTDFGGHPLENLADGAVDGTTKMLANFVQPPLVLTLDLNLGSDVHRNVCGYEMIGYDHRYPRGSWSFACEGRGKLHSYSVAQSGDPFVSGIASFFFGDDDVTGPNGACSTFPSSKYPDCASFDKATGYDPHACVSLSCGKCWFNERSGDGPGGDGTCVGAVINVGGDLIPIDLNVGTVTQPGFGGVPIFDDSLFPDGVIFPGGAIDTTLACAALVEQLREQAEGQQRALAEQATRMHRFEEEQRERAAEHARRAERARGDWRTHRIERGTFRADSESIHGHGRWQAVAKVLGSILGPRRWRRQLRTRSQTCRTSRAAPVRRREKA